MSRTPVRGYNVPDVNMERHPRYTAPVITGDMSLVRQIRGNMPLPNQTVPVNSTQINHVSPVPDEKKEFPPEIEEWREMGWKIQEATGKLYNYYLDVWEDFNQKSCFFGLYDDPAEEDGEDDSDYEFSKMNL